MKPVRPNHHKFQDCFEDVLSDLQEGDTIVAVAKKYKFKRGAFMQWINDDMERLNQYYRARECGVECLADEMIELADTECVTNEQIQHLRVKIDTRKWAFSKLHKLRFGDQSDQPAININGGNISIAWKQKDVDPLPLPQKPALDALSD